MKKYIFVIVTIIAGVAFTPSANAVEKFILTYQKQNEWVAQQDAEPLRNLIALAKKGKHTNFKVILPPSKRKLSINRLVVLRDILERQLKQSFIIEEVKGTANANTIILMPTH